MEHSGARFYPLKAKKLFLHKASDQTLLPLLPETSGQQKLNAGDKFF